MQSINRLNQLPEDLAKLIWYQVFDKCVTEVRGGCIAWHIECMGVCSYNIPNHLTHLFYDESVCTHQEDLDFQDAMQDFQAHEDRYGYADDYEY